MTIREYRPDDLPKLKCLHAEMGFAYEMPDIGTDEFVSRFVVADSDDKPVMILVARKTVEMYLLMDSNWESPAMRLEAFRDLHLQTHMDVKSQGFTDAHAFLPPQVERAFGKRLRGIFGWVKSEWRCYVKYL